MKISKLQLKNFKRFTNLTIDNIPSETKLVLLIGSNGSGKSTVFDAFSFINNRIKRDIGLAEDYTDYYRKNKKVASEVSIKFDNNDEVILPDNSYIDIKLPEETFYGRTSYRQIPKL